MTKVLPVILTSAILLSLGSAALATQTKPVQCELALFDNPESAGDSAPALINKGIAEKTESSMELGQGVAKLKGEAVLELQSLIDAEPALGILITKPAFINFLNAIATKKSLDEIRPLLFELWKDPEVQNLNLMKMTGVRVVSTSNTSALLDIISKAEFQNQKKRGLSKVAQNTKEFLVRMKLQLQGLRRSLGNAKKLVQEEMNPAALDSNLFDFYGYLNLGLETSRLRPWETPAGSFASIKPSDVKDMDPMTFIKVLMLASQIEAPISDYSDTSGHIFQLFPQASRFMGKTQEQVAYLQQEIKAAEAKDQTAKDPNAKTVKQNRMTCTNSWCFEENRHEGLLENMARAIAGFLLPNSKPFSADWNLSPFVPDDVLFHVMARANNELAASSTYYLLGSHAEGNLAVYLRNIRRDEVKHSTIFTGLFKYLKGDSYWTRVKGVMKKYMIELAEKGSESEYNSLFTGEPLTVIEIIYAQVQYEKHIRKYLNELPLKSLRKIYETDINLPPMPAVEMAPDKALKVEALSKIEEVQRRALAGWPKAQRERAYELEYFETMNNKAIYDVIAREMLFCRGAEDYGSERHNELVQHIQNLDNYSVAFAFPKLLSAKELSLLKESLFATLRDYQIMNNRKVRAMGLKVRFKNVVEGFEIVRDENLEAAPKIKR